MCAHGYVLGFYPDLSFGALSAVGASMITHMTVPLYIPTVAITSYTST